MFKTRVLLCVAFAAALGTAVLHAQSTVAVIPVVGATDGANGSSFKTALTLHNPSAESITGQLVFVCPDVDRETIQYSLAGHETKVYGDLLASFASSGVGSVDIQPLTGDAPIAVATIEGRSASSAIGYRADESSIGVGNAITAATTTLLVAPDLRAFRWNIGLRTFDRGAVLTAVQRSSTGSVVRTVEKTFPPNTFLQTGAAAFLGGDVAGGDSIETYVSDGSLILYAAETDNMTQQPVLHFAERVHYVQGYAGTQARVLPTDNPAVMSTPWTGAAWVSGIGNVRMTAEQTIDFSALPPAMVNKSTWRAANGDELYMSGVGVSLAPDAQGVINFEGVSFITGGTGKFAHATGALHFDGGADSSANPGTGFFNISGTLKLASQ